MPDEIVKTLETNNQTDDVVSTETIANAEQEVQPVIENKDKTDEFKLPTTKEEYETQIKSAVNREKTNFLKELGVKSVKEYKEQVSKAQEALSQHEAIVKQAAEIAKEKESLSQQYETLKQTSVLDKLGVREEYREDLLKLAKDKVTETNSFESVLKQLVETKYQYAVSKGAPKIGTEKTKTEKIDSTISPDLQKKYGWLK